MDDFAFTPIQGLTFSDGRTFAVYVPEANAEYEEIRMAQASQHLLEAETSAENQWVTEPLIFAAGPIGTFAVILANASEGRMDLLPLPGPFNPRPFPVGLKPLPPRSGTAVPPTLPSPPPPPQVNRYQPGGPVPGAGSRIKGIGSVTKGDVSPLDLKVNWNAEATMPQRPSWRSSELDVGARIEGQGYRDQVSFKGGVEVPYGTKGSVRPEYYKPASSIEVKNYDVETARSRASLVRNVAGQAVDRAGNLPPGTTQNVHIDIRGQSVSRADLNAMINRIVQLSNGAIQPNNINIVR